ncbi:DNA adenine methylase [Simonsiella muelleri]|uniref:site-specific DNA-methyltransferase (adenine-specific) n=2 Tax=Simonsiella muelleri ATCC 29453 TaxID=641147 RepID=V9HLW6_9NEIS|nr:DNA adenine methylase [Simonsiella muelleri]AUX61502.1 modification methylase HphIB [Simonsiella muelleri ATCC 29453]EFG30724.1 modification methylase HphIB [Simonsiella muelleri ATCC 29453]UBQ53558.1 DNA adenine methylase [Simonsiella muelleri]
MNYKKYPKINYIGNKEKIAAWICDQLPEDVNTVADVFSGGCSFSFEAKKRGYRVIANDILLINHQLALALIENNHDILTDEDVNTIFSGSLKSGFMTEHYANVFFFEDECKQLDYIHENISELVNPYKKALAFSLMRRAMIRKMPYSRFTIPWEKIKQLRDEEYSYAKYGRRRAYHNETFESHFRQNLAAYNQAVFDNGKTHQAFNEDVFDLLKHIQADAVYLDPPYTGTMNNYFGFYGLLDSYISSAIQQPFNNHFMDKKQVVELFERLIGCLKPFKYWLLSYNNVSHPNREELAAMLAQDGHSVKILETPHVYKVTGKENKQNHKEILFLVENHHANL